MRPTHAYRAAAPLCFILAWLCPAAAGASEPDVSVDSAAQFYDVRSPTGETVLARRRITTSLAVSDYDLLDKDRGPLATAVERGHAPELSFRARLRYDADYGAAAGEADPKALDQYVPGFSRGPVDLMYAYVEGRKLANGWVGFKIGRQYETDVLGWWSFDGGEVKVTTPYFLAAEAYAGLEVRGGMPLSTPRFERDGVWRGSRSDMDPALYPAFQDNDVAPAFGAALETAGFTVLHGRLSYRRVYNTGSSVTSDFAPGLAAPVTYDGTRISSEKLGYAIDGAAPDLGGAKAGVVYDFYTTKIEALYASLDWFATKKLTVSADYDFYAPVFDGDSIWNFFAANPMNDVALRGSYDVTEHLAVAAEGHVRVFTAQSAAINTRPSSPDLPKTDLNAYPQAPTFDEGGYLSVRHRVGEDSSSVHLYGDGSAHEGNRAGGDLALERVLDHRYLAEGRVSLWHWHDSLRPDRDAVSYGLVAGVGYKFTPLSRILFEYQLDANRLVGLRNRAMIWLTVAVAK